MKSKPSLLFMRQLCISKLTTIALTFVSFVAMAQVVERPRPAGWENLVPGGRFMDRFEPSAVIDNGWTTNCWGGDNVKPRLLDSSSQSSKTSSAYRTFHKSDSNLKAAQFGKADETAAVIVAIVACAAFVDVEFPTVIGTHHDLATSS